MRDAVPPCGTTGGGGGGGAGTSPAAARATPDARTADPAAPDSSGVPGGDPSRPSRPTPAPHRPQRPLASHPGDALGRPRNNPPDEEDPPEQTATTTFTPHAFKTTPEQHSRCVVLPDLRMPRSFTPARTSLNAPTGAWCSLTVTVGVIALDNRGLNAPTGAWCSLTNVYINSNVRDAFVSMHLQVRGAP